LNSLVLAVLSFLGFILAYHTYGRFLGKKLFNLAVGNVTPAVQKNDGMDYVPTKKEILFGHHFTSIAGTGPIVGPAIGVIWGWLPAVIWVVLGSIFMGAVHDLGALVISARKEGKSIGEITGDIVSPTCRTLFLLVIFFTLLIVVAIFAMIMGILFSDFPQSVFAVWMELPIAVVLGWLVYKKKGNVTILTILAVVLMYVTIYIGTFIPFSIPGFIGGSPVLTWVVILLIYGYIASVLPVQTLLQPRDYINAHELLIAMVLLCGGLIVGRPEIAAPVVQLNPSGAPPLFPFIFITIACGAISGFHSLVSSGTSSKQIASEKDMRLIGYGGMLLEGALAILVILACTAGLGSSSAWTAHYADWAAANGLGAKVGAFVTGGANILSNIGIPLVFAQTLLAVFVVSFAGTTIDTATRIQRYVVQELAEDFKLKPLVNKYAATAVVVIAAFLLASAQPGGSGAMLLWPLFGATNQLLAGLALLVISIYLRKSGKPMVYTLIPMIFMIIMTGWGMVLNMIGFYQTGNWLLFGIDFVIFALEIWMIIECVSTIGKSRKTELPSSAQA